MGWYFRISYEFFSRAIVSSVLTPLAILLSQVFLVVAFFLPLKILILLGSDHIPAYFPELLRSLAYRDLVIYLSIATALLYCASLVIDLAVSGTLNRQVNKLLEQSGKLAILPRQEKIVTRAYQYTMKSTAGGLFITAALVISALIYPKVFLFLIAYSGVVLLVISLFKTLSASFRALSTESYITLSNVLGGIVFFLSAGIMVSDFLSGQAPGVIAAIITLIIVRQGTSQLRVVTRSLLAMYGIRQEVSLILFDRSVLGGAEPGASLDDEPDSMVLAKAIVTQNVAGQSSVGHIKRLHSAESGVECFLATLADNSQSFFVRLYSAKKIALAKHEETLLRSMPYLPTLELLYSGEERGFYVHIFENIEGEPADKQNLALFRTEFFADLMFEIRPEETLIQQYRKSYPLLPQRLTADFLLSVLNENDNTNADNQPLIPWLEDHWLIIIERLSALPLVIVNSRVGEDSLLKNGDIVLANYWGRWSLEPIGAGWPVQPRYLAKLDERLHSVREERTHLRKIYPGDVCLSALLFKMDYYHQSRHYSAAIELLPQVRYWFEHRGEPLH